MDGVNESKNTSGAHRWFDLGNRGDVVAGSDFTALVGVGVITELHVPPSPGSEWRVKMVAKMVWDRAKPHPVDFVMVVVVPGLF